MKEQAIDVRCTLWPSHEDVEIAQGKLVAVEGKFTVNQADKDGEKVTYFNLSVSNIEVLGSGNSGTRTATTRDDAGNEPDDTDDVPY